MPCATATQQYSNTRLTLVRHVNLMQSLSRHIQGNTESWGGEGVSQPWMVVIVPWVYVCNYRCQVVCSVLYSNQIGNFLQECCFKKVVQGEFSQNSQHWFMLHPEWLAMVRGAMDGANGNCCP